MYIYDNYSDIFRHKNWICKVSHSTYLAIMHLKYQLQTSQKAVVVLLEFCQQPKKVLKDLAEKMNH